MAYFKLSQAEKQVLWLGVATVLCVQELVPAEGVLLESGHPVVWHKTEIPVTNGDYLVQIHLIIKSPCELLTNETVHSGLLNATKIRCDELFDQYIMRNLETLCPKSTFTHLVGREKRFAPFVYIIGAIAVVVVVVVGELSIVSLVKSSQNSNRMDTIEAAQEELQQQLKKLQDQVNLNRDQIQKLTENFNNAIRNLEILQDDHDQVVGKLPGFSFAISYITTRLQMGEDIIKQSLRMWKRGKLNPRLLDFLGVALECGDNCPIEKAIPRRCQMEHSGSRVHLEFTVPVINKSLIVVEAEPFTLMKKGENRTCKLVYDGPPHAIVSIADHCVFAVPVRHLSPDDVLLAPRTECKTLEDADHETKYFVERSCVATRKDTHLDYVQVKQFYDKFKVYCPGSTLTIGGRSMPCPTNIFILPIEVSYITLYTIFTVNNSFNIMFNALTQLLKYPLKNA